MRFSITNILVAVLICSLVVCLYLERNKNHTYEMVFDGRKWETQDLRLLTLPEWDGISGEPPLQLEMPYASPVRKLGLKMAVPLTGN